MTDMTMLTVALGFAAFAAAWGIAEMISRARSRRLRRETDAWVARLEAHMAESNRYRQRRGRSS